jgi:molecular chaperone GrpE
VVQVVQAGYRLHDRLLRPARVGISKGGPKGAAGQASEGEDPKPGDKVDTQA